MFVNGQFSNLQIHIIKNKDIYIVDKHHFVLPIWANLSLTNKVSYKLITIDYHTDTRKGFIKYASEVVNKRNSYNEDNEIQDIRLNELEKLKNSNIDTIIKSVKKLSNDEHIRTAFDLGYINEYHVINCSDKYSEPGGYYYVNEICYEICPPTKKTGKCNGKCPKHLLKYKMNRLEDNYFIDMGFSIPTSPFILDIDLDYFATRESLNPRNRTIINSLIKNAELITVAREKNYFNTCKKEKGFNVQEAEGLLVELIKSAL